MNIKLLVDGGSMKPGPALSQKLGPTGIPINKVIEKVNKETASFKGMQVPVEIEVDLGTKEFEIQVFSPPVSGLLKKEAGVQTGSGLQKKNKVANLSIEQIIGVAKQKQENLLCKDLKSSVKTVVGSCVSLGIMVESMEPIEVEKLINEGKYNTEINAGKTETDIEKKKELEDFFAQIKAEQDKRLKIEAQQKEAEAAAAILPEDAEKAPEEKAPSKK